MDGGEEIVSVVYHGLHAALDSAVGDRGGI
jgi:hypothetical protein